jgi:fatty-acyl-CoA synthase
MSINPYDRDLPKTPANFQPLTPLSFLARAAAVYPDRCAVIHGSLRFSYAEFYARSRRLASDSPPMLEAHYGVPMTGGVLNTLNTRLDPVVIAFSLDHADTKALIVDREFAAIVKAALPLLTRARPFLVTFDEREFEVAGETLDGIDYEEFLSSGDPAYAWAMPEDEWDAISLNYTSGTTGNPKGVVYHHRGAYLLAQGNVITATMKKHPVYLWTLPMFHCNGWCFPWSLSVVGGTHVCLRWVRADAIWRALSDHGVTHLCGAPIVMSTILNATSGEKRPLARPVEFFTAAAPPPEAVLAAMTAAGFSVTHLYGLTETYGPAVVNDWNDDWNALPPAEAARLKARQGVRYGALEDLAVMDPATLKKVPADGATMGEVMFRGNIVMKGYLKNPSANAEAFHGGWFHSGDLGVIHPDGYIQLKDRSKDIIISGGENISSIEVEERLYKHPAVQAAAVVARPDEKWGETPCAFVELRPGASASAEDLIAWCRDGLAKFKCPRHVFFVEIPKTSTGKIQKFKLRLVAREGVP